MGNEFDAFNSWKVLAHSDKIDKIVHNEALPYPVNWHIYASNVCCFNCNFCIMKSEKEQYGVKLERPVLEKAIHDARRTGARLIHFSGGGEPLMHPDLSDAIRMTTNNGMKVALSTNGYYLERLSAQVDHLRISLNAGTEQSHARIMQGPKDAWSKVIKNVKDAVNSRKGARIGLGFVLTHENFEEVDDFVAVAEECGVDFVHIRPGYWPEHNNEIIDAMNRVSPRSDKVKVYAIRDKFTGFWDKDKYPCRASPLFAVLSADGSFLLCQDRLDLRWGDYNKMTFEEIWHSQEHHDLIKQAQTCKIRCVESKANQIIHEFFVLDSVARDLL